jgi:hypothetical protein
MLTVNIHLISVAEQQEHMLPIILIFLREGNVVGSTIEINRD